MANIHRASTVLITKEGARRLTENEARNLDNASRASSAVWRASERLAGQYGEPGGNVWPVAFFQVGDEAAQPRRETDSLVWLIGNRVVLEEFSTNPDATDTNWSHRVTDYDYTTGEMVLLGDTERGEHAYRGNALEEVEDFTNIPGVFIRQLEDRLGYLAFAREFDGEPTTWPVRVEFE